MIDEKQIQEAIAYCNGKVDPNRNDAILLAACYILQDHMHPAPSEPSAGSFAGSSAEPYSFAAPVAMPEPESIVGNHGDSDFLRAVDGMDPKRAWRAMDDLMSTLMLTNRRIYDSAMRELKKEEA